MATIESANTPTSSEPSFILLHALSGKFLIGLAFFFLCVLCLLRFSILPTITTEFIGGTDGDSGLYLWLIRSNLRDLFELPWFNTNAFYPYTKTLAWSDNFILPSLLIWPLLKAGLSFALSFNILILTAQFLNGYLTALLIARLSGKFSAAFFGGVAFLSYSYFSVHLGHPQLQFAFFLPLGVGLLLKFFAHPKIALGFLLGLTLTAAFLTTVYYAIFLAVVLLVLVCAVYLIRPCAFCLREFSILAASSLAGVLPLLFFVPPYLAVKETFGERGIYEAYYFAANAGSYLSSSLGRTLYPGVPFHQDEEANLFAGIIIIATSLLALIRIGGNRPLLLSLAVFLVSLTGCCLSNVFTFSLERNQQLILCTAFSWITLTSFIALVYRLGKIERTLRFTFITNRDLITIFLFTALIFFFISLGPLGNPEKDQYALAPFRFFYSLIPGFDGIRAISRAGVVTVFALIMASSLYLGRYARSLLLNILIIFLTFVVALENLHLNFGMGAEKPAPQVLSALPLQSEQTSAAIVLPYAPRIDSNKNIESWNQFATSQVQAMNWLFPYSLPTVNGYSGIKSKFMRDLPRELSGFPDVRSVLALRKIAGLKHVMFRSSLIPSFDKKTFLESLALRSHELKLIEQDPEGNYLLELQGEVSPEKLAYLLVPSYPPQILSLSVRSKGKASTLKLFLESHVPGAPIFEQTFTSETNILEVKIPLPLTRDSVRPLQITVMKEGEGDLLISNIHLTKPLLKQ